MKKLIKSFFSVSMVLILGLGMICPVHAASVNLQSNKYINRDVYYSGSVAKAKNRVFRFNISSAKKVTFKFTVYGRDADLGNLDLYDSKGERIYRNSIQENNVLGSKTQQFVYYLSKGTYYAVIDNSGFISYDGGNYKFKYSIKTINRPAQNLYQSTRTACRIYKNKYYNDFVSNANAQNVYKFVADKSTNYRIKMTSYISYCTTFAIYYSNGNEKHKFYLYENDTINRADMSKKLSFKKGTYYIVVGRRYTSDQGVYSFKVTYA